MKPIRVDLTLRATTPIAHHEGVVGNIASLMREDIAIGGETYRVPIVSGDAMRHGLRESAADVALNAAGITGGLSEAAVRFLYNGGGIAGQPGASVDIAQYREMVEWYPAFGVLGGCVSNRMFPGTLSVNRAILVCEETVEAGVLPAWVAESAPGEAGRPSVAWVDEVQRVRMEPMAQPRHRAMAGEEGASYVERLLDGTAQNTIMPRTFEVVKAGALFWWSVTLRPVTDEQEDAFWSMLGRFLSDCRVGGKQGTGHGHLAPVDTWNCALKPAAIDANPFVLLGAVEPAANRHTRHMVDAAERFRAILGAIQS